MKKSGAIVWNFIEKITLFGLRLLYRMLHREITETKEASFLQFVKFGLVGISNTVVNYAIYAGTLALMQWMGLWGNYDYLIATGIGFVLSVLWSFFWNNKYVFTVEEGEHRSVFKALIKTYISYSVTGLFFNGAMMMVWVNVFHVSKFLGPIFNLLLSVPMNFLMNKLWAFR